MEYNELNQKISSIYKAEKNQSKVSGIGTFDEIINNALVNQSKSNSSSKYISALIDSYISGNNPHELYSSAEQILKFVVYLTELSDSTDTADNDMTRKAKI